MKTVVVEVQGGCVVEIYCDDLETQFVLVDWDNAEVGDDKAGIRWASACTLRDLPKETRAEVERATAEQ